MPLPLPSPCPPRANPELHTLREMHKLLSVPRHWCKRIMYERDRLGRPGACCLLGAADHVVRHAFSNRDRHLQLDIEQLVRDRLLLALEGPSHTLTPTISLAAFNDDKERKLPEVLALIKKAQSPRYASRP